MGRDDDGFDAFCVAAHPRLVAALSHIVADRAVGEELAQEALIRAHQRWDRVQSLESPLGWTVHVGANLARSHLRRRRLERRLVGGQQRPEVHHDPEITDTVALRSAMAMLTPAQREAVVLRHLLGLSPEQTGRLLGLDAAAVRARTHRAIRVLRQHLDEANREDQRVP